MASESSEEPVSIPLPSDLAAWIDEQAAAREMDRETLLVEVLAAHRAAADIDDDEDLSVTDLPGISEADVEDAVRTVVAERLDRIADGVAEELGVEQLVAEAVEEAVEEARVDLAAEATQAATDRTEAHVDDLREEFWEKIEDVRERVIQVKQEADAKAPADHDHPELSERLATLSDELEAVESAVDSVRSDLEADLDADRERIDDLEEGVEDVEDRLETVAYVLKELRDSSKLQNKRETSVGDIKRRAAELDLDRAACETCGNGVEIALLTDPECPHCQAAVNDVEPAGGFFGKPKLVKAQGIEPATDES